MLLIAFFCYIALFVMSILVVVQFLITLVSGANNAKLKVFARSLIVYIQQSLLYLSFNNDCKPFPFADWPVEEAAETGTEEECESTKSEAADIPVSDEVDLVDAEEQSQIAASQKEQPQDHEEPKSSGS
jgi:hypothetical protein